MELFFKITIPVHNCSSSTDMFKLIKECVEYEDNLTTATCIKGKNKNTHYKIMCIQEQEGSAKIVISALNERGDGQAAHNTLYLLRDQIKKQLSAHQSTIQIGQESNIELEQDAQLYPIDAETLNRLSKGTPTSQSSDNRTKISKVIIAIVVFGSIILGWHWLSGNHGSSDRHNELMKYEYEQGKSAAKISDYPDIQNLIDKYESDKYNFENEVDYIEVRQSQGNYNGKLVHELFVRPSVALNNWRQTEEELDRLLQKYGFTEEAVYYKSVFTRAESNYESYKSKLIRSAKNEWGGY